MEEQRRSDRTVVYTKKMAMWEGWCFRRGDTVEEQRDNRGVTDDQQMSNRASTDSYRGETLEQEPSNGGATQ